jgi:hypothetical protein
MTITNEQINQHDEPIELTLSLDSRGLRLNRLKVTGPCRFVKKRIAWLRQNPGKTMILYVPDTDTYYCVTSSCDEQNELDILSQFSSLPAKVTLAMVILESGDILKELAQNIDITGAKNNAAKANTNAPEAPANNGSNVTLAQACSEESYSPGIYVINAYGPVTRSELAILERAGVKVRQRTSLFRFEATLSEGAANFLLRQPWIKTVEPVKARKE